jgi:hypothetical protein
MNTPLYTRFPIWPTFGPAGGVDAGAGGAAGGAGSSGGPDAWQAVAVPATSGKGVDVAAAGDAAMAADSSDFWKVVVGAIGGFVVGGPVVAVAGAGVGQALRRKKATP